MRFALLTLAYLLGSIPFGLLLTRRLARMDVRRIGSGNIGATNVARAAGKKIAAWVLLLDAAKGFVPVALARWLLPPEQEGWVAAVGMAAFLGHLFPVFLRFRGGKGVATGLGVSLAVAPLAAVAGVLTWGVVVSFSRKSSLGSLCGAGVALAAAAGARSPPTILALIAAMALLVVVRHQANIRRLLRGEER